MAPRSSGSTLMEHAPRPLGAAGRIQAAAPPQSTTGAPVLVAGVAEPGSTGGVPGGRCTLQLAPDTMHEARIGSGELVMVALSSSDTPTSSSHSPSMSRSSPRTPATSSAVSSFGPATSSKADLAAVVPQDLWGQCCESYGCSLAHVAPMDVSSAAMAPPLGRFFVAAHAWPNARLPRGVAAPSAGLWASLGQPAGSCLVAVYRVPQHAENGGDCTELQLSMCFGENKGLPVAAPAAAAPGPGYTAVKPPASPAAAAASPATPRQARGRSETPGRGQAPSSTAGRGAATEEWPLRLLSSGFDWGDEGQRRLLERLALRHLNGRCLLPGNLVPLPVLGRSILFRVSAASDTINNNTWRAPPPVSPNTRMVLLLPGQETAAGAEEQTLGGSSNATRDVVAVAREAARAVAEGSSQEAAMEAAERAVRAGIAASTVTTPLGGVTTHLQALRELVTLPLTMPHLFARYKLRPPRGVLLHGPPGTGKTALARAAARAAGAQLLVINGPDIVTEFYGESEAGMRGIFAAARALAPSVLFIDEIDAIVPAREGAGGSKHGGGGGSDASTRLLTALLTLMDGLGEGTGDRVVVIAASNRPSALDSALRRPGRFERELEVGVPSPADREDILRVRLARIHHSLSPDDISALAAAAHGFVGADLAALCNEAAMAALRRAIAQRAGAHSTQQEQQQQQEHRAGAAPASFQLETQDMQVDAVQQRREGSGLVVELCDFAVAETRVKPSALREVSVELPQVRWEDVGGLSGIKQRLQESVQWPHTNPQALNRLGAAPPRGVLLYGPPGCSKTLLARAVAHEAKLNFLSIKGGELYSKFVGESERAISALFARARAAAPAVVFFDEVDGLAGTRSAGSSAEGGSSVGDRVLSQLLTEMDGLQPRLGVVVLAATNRPDRVDPALLRPGRFDRLLFVPPPDEEARCEILALQLRRTPLAPDVDIPALAAHTAGYTGADLGAVCREGALAALDEDMGASCVAARHLEAALALVTPSAPPTADMMAVYERFSRSGRLD